MEVRFITTVEILIGKEKLVISYDEAAKLLAKLKNLLEPQTEREPETGVPFSVLSVTACSSCCDYAIILEKASKKEKHENQKRD